jgi:hypothetical protein
MLQGGSACLEATGQACQTVCVAIRKTNLSALSSLAGEPKLGRKEMHPLT